MKNILCFGDSNTWGWSLERYDPELGVCGRFDRKTRWTGRLQALLGEDFYIIEDGVNGRTTMFDDPQNPMRNGLLGMRFALECSAPLDLVIIMLGTNDVKPLFNASPGVIASGIKALCSIIATTARNVEGHDPKILIVSPLPINEGAEKGVHGDNFDAQTAAKSRSLAEKFETVARRNGAFFLDAAELGILCDDDYVHLTAEGHGLLAEMIARKIKEIL